MSANARVYHELVEVLQDAPSSPALVSQDLVEVLQSLSGSALVDQALIEVLQDAPTASPTTPTGAGVTHAVVEVLQGLTDNVRVVHDLVEVLQDHPADGAAITSALIEVLQDTPGLQARIDQALIEVLQDAPTASPTTPTGAGVTHALTEVLMDVPSSATLVFTLDAVILGAPKGGDFDVDAVLLKSSGTKTFSVDATLRGLGSFNLDAILHKVQPKSFTVDAFTYPAWGGWSSTFSNTVPKFFTLNAVIRAYQLNGTDRFTHSQKSTDYPFTGVGVSGASSYASLLTTTGGNSSGSRNTGQLKTSDTSWSNWETFWTWPIFVLRPGWSVTKAELALGGYGTDYSDTDFTLNAYLYDYSVDGEFSNFTRYQTSAEVAALTKVGSFNTANWVISSAHNVFSDIALAENLSTTTNPSASGRTGVLIASDNYATGTAPTGNEYITFRYYADGAPLPRIYVTVSGGTAITVDAELATAGLELGSFTVNAVLFKSSGTKTFTVNAEIRAVAVVADFDVDAILFKHWDKTFAVEAEVAFKFMRVFAWIRLREQRGLFTVSAILARNAITLDAQIRAGGAFTLAATVLKTVARTLTVNAWLQSGTLRQRSFYLDAQMRPGTFGFYVNATISRTFATHTGSANVDAVCQEKFYGSLTLDAYIGSRLRSFTVNADVRRVGEQRKTLTLAAVKRQGSSGTFPVSAEIAKKIFRIDAKIAYWFTLNAEILKGKSFKVNAYIRKAPFTLNAVIRPRITLDAQITKNPIFTVNAIKFRPGIGQVCWNDSFTRTVSTGLGGQWTLMEKQTEYGMGVGDFEDPPLVSHAWVSNGRAMISHNTTNGYWGYDNVRERWYNPPIQQYSTGVIQFDFLTTGIRRTSGYPSYMDPQQGGWWFGYVIQLPTDTFELFPFYGNSNYNSDGFDQMKTFKVNAFIVPANGSAKVKAFYVDARIRKPGSGRIYLDAEIVSFADDFGGVWYALMSRMWGMWMGADSFNSASPDNRTQEPGWLFLEKESWYTIKIEANGYERVTTGVWGTQSMAGKTDRYKIWKAGTTEPSEWHQFAIYRADGTVRTWQKPAIIGYNGTAYNGQPIAILGRPDGEPEDWLSAFDRESDYQSHRLNWLPGGYWYRGPHFGLVDWFYVLTEGWDYGNNTYAKVAGQRPGYQGIDNFSFCNLEPVITVDAHIWAGGTQTRFIYLNAQIVGVQTKGSYFWLDATLRASRSFSFTLAAEIRGFSVSAWICWEDGSLYGGRIPVDAHIRGNDYILWPGEQSGSDGSTTATDTFYSPSASFNAGMVGSTIIIGGVPYTIVAVIDEHTVTISPEIGSGQSGLPWSIQPGPTDPSGAPLPTWYKANRKYRVNITLDGTDVTGDVIWRETSFAQHAKTNPGTFQLTLKGVHAWDGGEEVIVTLDDFRQFGGYVLSVERMYEFEAAGEGLTILRGADFNVLFDKLIVYNKASADDPSGSYRNWKNFAKGTLDTTIIAKVFSSYVDLPAGFEYSMFVDTVGVAAPEKPWAMPTPGSPLRQVMQSLSQVTNAVWWIDPYLHLHYNSRTTVTAPFPITDGLGGVTSRNILLSEDMSRLVTETILWGTLAYTTEGEVIASRKTADAYTSFGPWQYGEFRDDLHHEAYIDRRTDSIIERYGQTIKKAKVTLFDPGYQAGQVADVRLTAHGITEILPIRSLTLTFAVGKEPEGSFYYAVPRYELEVGLDPEDPWDIYDYLPFPDNPGTPYKPVRTRTDEYTQYLIDDFDRSIPQTQYTQLGTGTRAPSGSYYKAIMYWADHDPFDTSLPYCGNISSFIWTSPTYQTPLLDYMVVQDSWWPGEWMLRVSVCHMKYLPSGTRRVTVRQNVQGSEWATYFLVKRYNWGTDELTNDVDDREAVRSDRGDVEGYLYVPTTPPLYGEGDTQWEDAGHTPVQWTINLYPGQTDCQFGFQAIDPYGITDDQIGKVGAIGHWDSGSNPPDVNIGMTITYEGISTIAPGSTIQTGSWGETSETADLWLDTNNNSSAEVWVEGGSGHVRLRSPFADVSRELLTLNEGGTHYTGIEYAADPVVGTEFPDELVTGTSVMFQIDIMCDNWDPAAENRATIGLYDNAATAIGGVEVQLQSGPSARVRLASTTPSDTDDISMTLRDGVWYTVKVWLSGSIARLRIWETFTEVEPQTWAAAVSMTPLPWTPGEFAIYFENRSTAQDYTEFQVDNLYRMGGGLAGDDSEGEVLGSIGEGWNWETRLVEGGLFETSARVTRGTLVVFDEMGRFVSPDDWSYADGTGMLFRISLSTAKVTVGYRAWIVNVRSQYSTPRLVENTSPHMGSNRHIPF